MGPTSVPSAPREGSLAGASESPRPAARGTVARRTGLSARGWLLLGLIGATVFAVTILRIDRFVLAENHRDAPSTARVLLAGLRDSEADTLAALLADERLARQLADHRLLEDGRLLLRFGYLFQLVRDERGEVTGVVAWPRRHGRSGARAFHVTVAGDVHDHPNAAGAWSGAGAPPDLDADGWLRRPAAR